MRVILAPAADEELTRHIAYIAERNPQAAERQYERITEALDALEQTPRRGRPGRAPGTRELVISGTPYLAVYEVTASEVRILHIHHSSQNWQQRSIPPDEDS